MKPKQLLLLALLCCTLPAARAQKGGAVNTVQPKIMVIPYAKEGEDIRTLLEKDVNKRIALTRIKEAFDNRGFTTVDFVAKLKTVASNAAFSAESKVSIRDMIVQQSGADIYVEAEIDIRTSTTSGNTVKVLLTGYEVSTGNSLANKVGESGKFFIDDIAALTDRATDKCIEDFLNTMQAKFTDIVSSGKSIVVQVDIDQNSERTMSSEVGTQGLQLSDEIEIWMEKNAYKNAYHIQGSTDNQMVFDDVRIPLKDPDTGMNYNANKFGLALFQHLRSLGVNVKRNIKGNTLFVTIQ
jgi:hypothetical protein